MRRQRSSVGRGRVQEVRRVADVKLECSEKASARRFVNSGW